MCQLWTTKSGNRPAITLWSCRWARSRPRGRQPSRPGLSGAPAQEGSGGQASRGVQGHLCWDGGLYFPAWERQRPGIPRCLEPLCWMVVYICLHGRGRGQASRGGSGPLVLDGSLHLPSWEGHAKHPEVFRAIVLDGSRHFACVDCDRHPSGPFVLGWQSTTVCLRRDQPA